MSIKETPIFKVKTKSNQVNENIFFNFSKNDFEEFGSIIEFEINVKCLSPSVISLSFFDKDKAL